MKNLTFTILILAISCSLYSQTQTQDLNMGLYQLQFLSASGGSNRIQSFGGSSPGTWTFKSRFDNMVFEAGENDNNKRQIIFSIGNTERARFNTVGNFGIGIQSPVSRLHVKDNNSNTGQSVGLTIEQDGTGDAKLQYLLTGVQRWVSGIDNSDSDKFIIGRGIDWAQGKLLTINNNGYVGIGTSAPTRKLDINGEIGSTGKLSLITNSSSLGDIISLYGDRIGATNMYGFGIETNGGTLYSKAVSGYNWYIQSNANNGSSAIMKLNSNELVVDGRIRSEEVKVEIINGPDYVFQSDYKLRSLQETQDYINQNKHLPEIPSAKTMETDGVDLGEMNMLLLKKIEELTLHMIRIDEQLQEVKRENQKLKTHPNH